MSGTVAATIAALSATPLTAQEAVVHARGTGGNEKTGIYRYGGGELAGQLLPVRYSGGRCYLVNDDFDFNDGIFSSAMRYSPIAASSSPVRAWSAPRLR